MRFCSWPENHKPAPSCGCDVGGLPQPIACRLFSQPLQIVLTAALLRRAPRQGVPRRVASLTSLVDSFVNEQGGDRPIHRLGTQAACCPMCGLLRRHHPVLPGRAATVPQSPGQPTGWLSMSHCSVTQPNKVCRPPVHPRGLLTSKQAAPRTLFRTSDQKVDSQPLCLVLQGR